MKSISVNMKLSNKKLVYKFIKRLQLLVLVQIIVSLFMDNVSYNLQFL